MVKRVPSILERPTYSVSMAAAILGLRSDKVLAWLDGYERDGKFYPPVIRTSATGDKIVTWGEFVELGYLKEYRKKKVSLQRLRPVIDALREELDTPYPLATAQLYIYRRDLVMKLQEESGIPHSIAIVMRTGQTLILMKEAERFFQKVVFHPPDTEDAEVCRIHPEGKNTPVVIDPLVRFGRPAVNGVAVERLWELHDAGESIKMISEAYDMQPRLIRTAVAYQEQHRSLAA